jgi:hypothetical protein
MAGQCQPCETGIMIVLSTDDSDDGNSDSGVYHVTTATGDLHCDSITDGACCAPCLSGKYNPTCTYISLGTCTVMMYWVYQLVFKEGRGILKPCQLLQKYRNPRTRRVLLLALICSVFDSQCSICRAWYR